MADDFTERAVRNLRQRHTDAARSAALSIQKHAGYILAELEAGRVPTYHLVQDAVELETRIAALDAVRDASGIYESGD